MNLSDFPVFLHFLSTWCVAFFNLVTAYWWGASFIILSLIELFLVRDKHIKDN